MYTLNAQTVNANRVSVAGFINTKSIELIDRILRYDTMTATQKCEAIDTVVNAQVTDDHQISMENLQRLVSLGKVRLRAFGETAVFGLARPFEGNFEEASRALPQLLSENSMRVYCDDEGLFVGPSNPALVEEGMQ